MHSEWFSIGEIVQHKNDPNLIGIIRDINPNYHSNIVQYILVEWTTPDEDLWQDWYSGTYLKRREQPMSKALWCDKKGHAFSAADPDKEHYTSTRSIKDGAIVTQVTVELDFCGACAKDVVLHEAPQLGPGTGVQDAVPSQVG